MIPYPEIDPVLFQIGPLRIQWYGLMYLGGILGGWYLIRKRMHSGRYAGWNDDQLADLIFYIALGVILGGRVGSVLFYNFDKFVADPLMMFRIWEGGMSFHGGLLGVLVACWWYGRKPGRSFLELVEIAAPVVPIGLGLGRLGNFINGELWGKPTTLPWGVIFEGQARHASQLYEFLLEGVILFAFLYWFSSQPRTRGHTAGWFAILYGTFRIAVEFVREPDAPIGYLALGWVTMGQVLSLPMIFIGIFLLFIYPRRNVATPLTT